MSARTAAALASALSPKGVRPSTPIMPILDSPNMIDLSRDPDAARNDRFRHANAPADTDRRSLQALFIVGTGQAGKPDHLEPTIIRQKIDRVQSGRLCLIGAPI